MTSAERMYRLFNILSLDVAAGSVCAALFFARLLDVVVLPLGLISLGLTVWIIYTVDHLMDARNVKLTASTARHRFHQEHFKVLAMIVPAVTAANVVIIFFIRKPVFLGGLVLVFIVGIYLFIHRYVRFPKELLIAMLYTAGVLLPSISVTALPLETWPWITISQFAFTALLNLMLFSWYDAASDRIDGNTSIALLAGEGNIIRIIWSIAILNFVLSIFNPDRAAAILLALMNLILIVVFVMRDFFSKEDRFRLVGDAVFFIPLIYWLL
jgi:hypothetical protein